MKIDQHAGKIITFYSYKGGTGRTMALANIAWIFASNRKRVLVLDWDLEAPGLHCYFQPFLIDKDITSSEGIIDFVINFADEAIKPLENSESMPTDWYVQHANIKPYVLSLNFGEFPEGGKIDFVPAGRQGATYAARVTSFNWQNFYDRLGGGAFLEATKEKMRAEYDYILIDSRTGVSDTSGICTVQMPDILVVCFTLNNQSIKGASAIANSVHQQRKKSNVRIFPVPMRVDMAEKAKLEARREYARNKFAFFPDQSKIIHRDLDEYWGAVELLYVPYYAYEELLSVFGDRLGQINSLLASLERLASYLTDGEIRGLVPLPEEKRLEILNQYLMKGADKISVDEQNQIAENLFTQMTPDKQPNVRRLFTRLIRLARPEDGERDTYVSLPVKDLGPIRDVVHPFVNAKILIIKSDEKNKQEIVQISNKALIQQWKRLQEWINEDREFLLWRQRLKDYISDWEDRKRNTSALLTGASLIIAKSWYYKRSEDLNEREKLYIASSLSRRKIVTAVGLTSIVVVIVAVVGGWLAYERWYQAELASTYDFTLRAADTLAKSGEFTTALSYYIKAIELDPANPEAYIKRGILYHQQDLYDKAIADYSQAIKLRFDYAVAYFNRGISYLQKRDIIRAMTDFDRAIALDSNDPNAYFERGSARYKAGDLDFAITDYTEAIKLRNDYSEAFFNRGLVYLEKGDKKNAAADFKAILSLKADPQMIEAVQARLKQLESRLTPKSQHVVPKVYMHYNNQEDIPVLKVIEKMIAASKQFAVQNTELVSEGADGDVRYFYKEDERYAVQIKSIIESALTKEEIKVDLKLFYRDHAKFPGAQRGRIEVWIPPLSRDLPVLSPNQEPSKGK